MALTARSLHDTPNADATVDARYPNGDKGAVVPASLGLNLTAFNAANINLQNLPANASVDINYRTYLTGTNASTAILSVNASSGTLGNWVIDGSGNGIANSTAVAGSGTLFVTATDSANNVQNFPLQQWSIQAASQSGAVKYHANLLGTGLWFDNQYWSGNESKDYNSNISTIGSNLNVGFIEIILTWAAIEATQGDVSAGMKIINSVVSTVRGINANRSSNNKLRIIVKQWHKQFYPQTGQVCSTTDSRMWPAYVISQGNWVVCVDNSVSKTTTQNQLDYSNSSALAAFQNAMNLFVAQLDPIPEIEMFAPFDESSLVTAGTAFSSNALGLSNIWNDIHSNMLPSAPHTLIWKTVNWAAGGGATEVKFFNDLYANDAANNPGRFCYGGPDQSLRNTTAQKCFRGATTGSKDWRGKLIWVDHTEQYAEGGWSGPAAILANAQNVQGAQYCIGVTGTQTSPGGSVTWSTTDWYNAFKSVSGVVNSNLPTLGSFNTTP